MAADVAGDFAATGGMPDQSRVVQVECLDQLGEVISVGVQVVPVPGLPGTPAAATVMSDGAEAVGCDEERLVIPGVGGERPAVA